VLNLREIERELLILSNLYNLHKLEVKNIFNRTLIDIYSNKKKEFNLSTINFNNDVVLYNTINGIKKVFQFRRDDYKKFYNRFNRKIVLKNRSDIKLSIVNSIEDDKFIALEYDYHTRRAVYFKAVNSNNYLKKFHFKYNCKDKQEIFFFRTTEENIYINKPKNVKDILKKEDLLENKTFILNCKVTPYEYIRHISVGLAKKIYDKTDGDIALKFKYVNPYSKVVVFESNFYMTEMFLTYLDNWLKERINYGFSLMLK